MSSEGLPTDQPGYVVIFTSQRTPEDKGYAAAATRMVELAERQEGFMGMASVRDASGAGITVSYWRSLADIKKWKDAAEHREAQRLGKERWYARYRVTVARVERDSAWPPA